MNLPRLLAAIFCIFVCRHAYAQSQDIDKELSALAEKLAVPIQDHARKKVTVIDFSDLEGRSSELGKYIAEQLTVNLVMGKREFAVLDRANLKSILKEHKLTSDGLVDPANAKQLGQFAGVDALILGTIVVKNQTTSLTAKIITTDTAEIVGAARAEFKTDENIQQLLSKPSANAKEEPDEGEAGKHKAKIMQSFGDLSILLDGLREMADGSISISLVLQNKSSKNVVAVAMYAEPCFVPPCKLRSSLTGADGTECTSESDGLTGIQVMRSRPQNLTEIQPGSEIKISIKYSHSRQFSENLTSLRLQAELIVNARYDESQYANFRVDQDVLPPHCKIQNVAFDIPVQKNK